MFERGSTFGFGGSESLSLVGSEPGARERGWGNPNEGASEEGERRDSGRAQGDLAVERGEEQEEERARELINEEGEREGDNLGAEGGGPSLGLGEREDEREEEEERDEKEETEEEGEGMAAVAVWLFEWRWWWWRWGWRWSFLGRPSASGERGVAGGGWVPFSCRNAPTPSTLTFGGRASLSLRFPPCL